ncbi:KPN_02809 family neutral zinc metallopeptidase [Chitinimonas sp. PSY-7]|uniref:KPN_02809 family neutral zinc metallopeptidase n=1 Tax=Chitinimonas sp. PSY-7 TaxID=3459088 RepID=UPI00403FD43D
MRLDDQRESDNVDDLRGQSGGGGGFGVGRLGIVGLIIAGGLSYFTGLDFSTAIRLVQGGEGLVQQTAPRHTQVQNARDPEKIFASKVLASTEDVWGALFQREGQRYQPPRLVLFRGGVDTACGYSQSAIGPFYCPGDSRLFIDLDFLTALQNKLGAQGDFARAYVIAHEVGHHIQNLLGTSTKVHEAQQRASKVMGNALSVKLELQADCYAGVWAHAAAKAGLLEPGDMEEAIKAASAVGDDSLMRGANQQVVPDAFTHGSSEQRMHWFKVGMDSGAPGQCNTFGKDN